MPLNKYWDTSKDFRPTDQVWQKIIFQEWNFPSQNTSSGKDLSSAFFVLYFFFVLGSEKLLNQKNLDIFSNQNVSVGASRNKQSKQFTWHVWHLHECFSETVKSLLCIVFIENKKVDSVCTHWNWDNNHWVTTILEHLQIIYKCQDSNALSLLLTPSPKSSNNAHFNS